MVSDFKIENYGYTPVLVTGGHMMDTAAMITDANVVSRQSVWVS